MLYQLTFRSGAQVEVRLKRLEIDIDKGAWLWWSYAGGTGLLDIDTSEVVCVAARREPRKA